MQNGKLHHPKSNRNFPHPFLIAAGVSSSTLGTLVATVTMDSDPTKSVKGKQHFRILDGRQVRWFIIVDVEEIYVQNAEYTLKVVDSNTGDQIGSATKLTFRRSFAVGIDFPQDGNDEQCVDSFFAYGLFSTPDIGAADVTDTFNGQVTHAIQIINDDQTGIWCGIFPTLSAGTTHVVKVTGTTLTNTATSLQTKAVVC